MTIPMRIGRRLDSGRSVVGFAFGWSRPSMAGLYYWVRGQGSGARCQENQVLRAENVTHLRAERWLSLRELAGACVGIGRRCFCGVPRFPRLDNAVVVVFNRQRGAAAEADVAHRLVAPGKPKILHLHVLVMNFTFLRPE